MKGVIFAGGVIEDITLIKQYIKDDSFIVCADSGYDSAILAGFKPNVLIGDMDSISQIPTDIEIISVNQKKDQTDTQLCIDYMADMGFSDVLLFGALGGRIDHTFANIMLISYGMKKGVNIKIISLPTEMFVVKRDNTIHGQVGDILSLFPINGVATGITTHGLEYPLIGETLKPDVPRGISNVFGQNEVSIGYEDGLLLAIHIKSGGEINW